MWQVVLLIALTGCGSPRSTRGRIDGAEVRVTSDTRAAVMWRDTRPARATFDALRRLMALRFSP